MTETTRRSYYRLPSGAIVDRKAWWDSDNRTGPSSEELGYVMGSLLKPVLDTQQSSDVQIVWWEGVTPELADAVQRALGSPQRPLGLSSADLAHRHGAFSPIEPDRGVVVLTDVIVTARTISSVLRTLRRMEATPLAVATILDARNDHGSPIRGFGGLVPVVGCAAARALAPLPLPGDAAVVDVDSNGHPIARLRAPEYAIPAERFVGWLRARAKAGIYVGHIDRGPTRHFSTYLDIAGLVRTNTEIATAVAEAVPPASLGGPPDEVLCVVYPSVDDAPAAALGAQVAALLSEVANTKVETIEAFRDRDGAWRTKSNCPWPFAFRAVIVDWGAVTATTVRDLLDLAARGGAREAHAVVLTSQLDRETERRMTGVAAIRVEKAASVAPGEQAALQLASSDASLHQVPVSTEFLASVPMGMAARSECHLCALAQLMREIGNSSPTRLMRDHAKVKYDLYRPRARQDILGEQAVDLVGTELGPAGAAEVWVNHLRLVEAQRSRVAHSALRSEFLAWSPSAPPSDILSWLRLLTVEPYWLDRAPLDAADVRSHIGRVCSSFLTGAPSHEFSIGARWQAAIVLRSASKQTFLERFGEILDGVGDQELIAAELCQGMLTILSRPYNHQIGVLNQVLTALLDARDRLRDKGRRDRFAADLLFTVNALYRDAVVKRMMLDLHDDPVAAWHGLQSSYAFGMHTHAGALTSMLVVLNALSGPAAERAAACAPATRDGNYWALVRGAWEVCWDFLAQSVFPFLPTLADLFEGEVPAFADGQSTDLLAFTPDRAARFGDRLRELEDAPSAFTEDVRADLELEALEWFNGLLRAPERRPTTESRVVPLGPRLVQALDETPCDVGAAWKEARARVSNSGANFQLVAGVDLHGVKVFCRRGLLVNALAHVLENATADGRATPDETVAVAAYMRIDGQNLHLLIRNSHTEVTGSKEGGLTKLSGQLEAFGATVIHGPADADRADYDATPVRRAWTYDVEITLKAWYE